MADTWGGSWGASWGNSWSGQTVTGHSGHYRQLNSEAQGRYVSVIAQMRLTPPQIEEVREEIAAIRAEPKPRVAKRKTDALKAKLTKLDALTERALKIEARADLLDAIDRFLEEQAALSREAEIEREDDDMAAVLLLMAAA